MKKKYFSPEMEELEVETPVLLDASAGCSDETEGGSEQAGNEEVSDISEVGSRLHGCLVARLNNKNNVI